jgi:hypothetical protein
MPGARQDESDDLQFMIGLLIRAVQELSNEGRSEIACHIAAAAWVACCDTRPEEAEKLNSTIRSLTRLDPENQKEASVSGAAT